MLSNSLEVDAEQYSPAFASLVALRSMTCNGVALQAGDPVPQIDINRQRQLIRTRRAKVVYGATDAVVERLKPAPVVQEAPKTEASAFACSDCEKTFKTKLNLGAHRRTHKK